MAIAHEEIELAFESYKQRKKEKVDQNQDIKGKHLRIIGRPLARFALWAQRKIKNQKVEIIGNKKYKLPKSRPVLFSVTHIGKYDFEIVNEQVKEQFYVLASDFRNMYGNFNGFMMNVFGCYFVDEIDKEDRKYSSLIMKKTLRTKAFGRFLKGMIYSEGTWNLSPNEIIYDTNFGAVDIAMSTNAVILPIAIEQYGKNFVVNFGEIYDPCAIAKEVTDIEYNALNETDEKQKLLKFKTKLLANDKMRDILATLKYQIWERQGVQKRDEIPDDYWEKYVKERQQEWPGYSMQEQIDSVYHPQEKLLQQEVETDLSNLKPNDNNLFMFTNPNRINNFIDACQNIETIERLLQEHRNSIQDSEPITVRLAKYKELKKTKKQPKL